MKFMKLLAITLFVGAQCTAALGQGIKTVSEAELSTLIAPASKGNAAVSVESQRDGFLINGQPFVDPEGRITAHTADSYSGNITYIIQQSPYTMQIKYMNAASGVAPLVIAQGQMGQYGWQLNTASGKAISGTQVITTSRGFLVTRDSAAFLYVPGVGVTNISAPRGFEIAAFQNGDVATTGFILLERPMVSAQRGNEIAQLGNSIASLGALLGTNKKEDYMLLNVKTGKTFAINAENDGKNVRSMSNCVRKNRYVNQCSSTSTRESLYRNDGSANLFHYYWRIRWFQTEKGPMLVAQERGVAEINLVDLVTGKKVSAFQRGLGIAGYAVKQNPDGKIQIVAQMGLSRESLNDARAALDVRPAVTEKPAEVQPAQVQE